jgi:hypothetical protein
VLGAFFTDPTLKLNFVPEASVLVKVNLALNLLEDGEVHEIEAIDDTTVQVGLEGRVISEGNYI